MLPTEKIEKEEVTWDTPNKVQDIQNQLANIFFDMWLKTLQQNKNNATIPMNQTNVK